MMLLLPSPLRSISSKYSSAVATTAGFDLDARKLTFVMSQPKDRQRMPSQDFEEHPLSSGFSRFSNWSSISYDPFSSPSAARRSPPGHQGTLRSRMPPEVHSADSVLPRAASHESITPMHFGSSSYHFGFEPGSHVQHDLSLNSTIDEPSHSLRRQSQDSYHYSDDPANHGCTEYEVESHGRRSSDMGRNAPRYHTRRRPFNQDEFDGPSQLLSLPVPQQELARAQALRGLPTHLSFQEQEEVSQRLNDILSHCAFHFIAKYQFPVPLERDRPRIRSPADREWTEWAHLLKRLATKRRIPARVLFDNQIRQFVTIIENSIAARQNTRDQQARLLKDDRYMLQLVSAGTQVAKILMDSQAMDQLDNLYSSTESIIMNRRARAVATGFQ